MQVFKKFGVEKFDPLNEKFDPNRHYALFQIPDPSKPSGTVAAVVKVFISYLFTYLAIIALDSAVNPELLINLSFARILYLLCC